ncbi:MULTISPECIES: HNH endonuclease family protein [Actinomadura]|uniref:HNH endonuclease family protein n=1 Tax=Actinomadura TaxID=1988 RepID=UPI0004220E5B|nr:MULTISPECIES: HNH endonuclease family protein [Actinomadura]RSN71306.1 HNH endonuclease [Actinomadura sp. WAC 06369]
MKRLPAAAAATAAAAAVLVAAAPPASAAPPPPPGETTARTHLAELTVRAEGSMTGYDREKFPHWIDQGDSCSTREAVLKRDGENVAVGSDCYPTSGSWYSPYDGATWRQPSDIDIDHMVALAEAWRSGASSWTTSRRRTFANDLGSSQLWAVTDNVNQSKGDQDPAEWTPPRAAFHCMYARSWIDVKWRYGLTVDAAERDALAGLLDTC